MLDVKGIADKWIEVLFCVFIVSIICRWVIESVIGTVKSIAIKAKVSGQEYKAAKYMPEEEETDNEDN